LTCVANGRCALKIDEGAERLQKAEWTALGMRWQMLTGVANDDRCALKIDKAAERCVTVLLDLIQTKVIPRTHTTERPSYP